MDLLCRCCLVVLSHNDYNLLKDRNLAIRFVLCTSMNVEQSDDLPKCICDNCNEMIWKIYDFQRMCSESIINLGTFVDEQIKQLQEQLKTEDDLSMNVDDGNKFEIKVNEESSLIKQQFSMVHQEYDNLVTDSGNTINNTIVEHKKEQDTSVLFKNYNPSTSLIKYNDRSKKKPKEIFHCDICPKWFYSEETQRAHARTHQGLKPYFCSVCCRQFTRSENLRNHTKQMHNKSRLSYHCPHDNCTNVYSAKRSLRAHIRENHSQQAPPSERPKDSHVCEKCGKQFKRKVFLSRHRYVHLDKSQYPFTCEYCEKRFYMKQFLRLHLQRHERKFTKHSATNHQV